MKPSKIAWTDFSGGNLNYVTGCTPVSAGCERCYARAIYERFGRDHSVVETHESKLERVKTTRFPEWSPKRGEGHRPMAFVVDSGDIFHERVSDWFLFKAFDLMAERQDVVWQVLTKRPAWMCEFMATYYRRTGREVLPNLWLGVTVENQAMADERIPLLLGTPAAVRWVSVEPMLSPVDLTAIDYDRILAAFTFQGRIDWCVVGGESGPNRRPFDVQWALDLYRQCEAAGVAYFGKQNSGLRPGVPLALPGVGVVQQWPEEVTQ